LAYTVKQIFEVVKGAAIIVEPDQLIEHLLVDSRKIIFPHISLFFALATPRKDGSIFIKELYEKDVRNFVVQAGFEISPFPGSNFIFVESALDALQQVAAYHRRQFNIPVIGITGSNGKTIVKEWLYHLLRDEYKIVRSPKSYNSQIGVPLSVWQMNASHTLAIFEAGISQSGEMENLEEIIKPTIGVFINIGEAHRENFNTLSDKAIEKAILFKNASTIVYSKDGLNPFSPEDNARSLFAADAKFFSWSRISGGNITVLNAERLTNSTVIKIQLRDERICNVVVPFTDQASIDNAITSLTVMLALGYSIDKVANRFLTLASVEMRMQLKKGINNCTIINDSYSNDFSSLEISLDYLKQQQGVKRTIAIVSEMKQSGWSVSDQLGDIIFKIKSRNIGKGILIGEHFYEERESRVVKENKDVQLEFFSSTEAFLQHSNTNYFKNAVVLLKGARTFKFENISRWLEEKTHQTVMEVNLNAMVHNLKQYQQFLKPATKVMAMVKAFSYGSGSVEVANILQFYKVDYLAVAYADEGIHLRKSGINMPIMVMNPEVSTFSALVEYNLEPEIYSFNLLDALSIYLNEQAINQFPVHLKFDTGMHRLGFETRDVDKLVPLLHDNNVVVIKSVFSHLVASDDASLDTFTLQQAKEFEHVCGKIQSALNYSFIRHLSNTAAIFRHPNLQYDMVRLGIGLYGVNNTGKNLNLQTVATLKSTIAQIRKVKAGESVGYSKKQILDKDSSIATVRIGYADGFSRKFSNGIGKMFLHGKLAPVVGNVCMDMTMLDITRIKNVQEGDEVEIFGANLPVEQIAVWAETISYEIMTGISERVKRVYYEE
jgi:alanine racemase